MDDDYDDDEYSEEQILQMAMELKNNKSGGFALNQRYAEAGMLMVVLVLLAWNIYMAVKNHDAKPPPQTLPPPPPPPAREISNFPFILGFCVLGVFVLFGIVVYTISTANVFTVKIGGLIVALVISIIFFNLLGMSMDVVNYRGFLAIIGNLLIALIVSLISWLGYGNSLFALGCGVIYLFTVGAFLAFLPMIKLPIGELLQRDVMWHLIFIMPMSICLGLLIMLTSMFNFLSQYKILFSMFFLIIVPAFLWFYQLHQVFLNQLQNQFNGGFTFFKEEETWLNTIGKWMNPFSYKNPFSYGDWRDALWYDEGAKKWIYF